MTTDGVTAALKMLGDNADAVAATLGRLGIKGHPLRMDVCPVAEFLKLRFPGHTFEVSGRSIRTPDMKPFGIHTPVAVEEFVAGFDHGQWPELFAKVGA